MTNSEPASSPLNGRQFEKRIQKLENQLETLRGWQTEHERIVTQMAAWWDARHRRDEQDWIQFTRLAELAVESKGRLAVLLVGLCTGASFLGAMLAVSLM